MILRFYKIIDTYVTFTECAYNLILFGIEVILIGIKDININTVNSSKNLKH